MIHGASAGAGSVALHTVAYGGRDDKLFVGAMAESVFFPAQPFASELEWQFDRLAVQVGCEAAADPVSCLRDTPVALLQAANVALPFPGRPDPPLPLFYWTPCVDGDFLPDLPYALFSAGRFLRVPVLYGVDTDEGSVFAANSATPDDMATFFANNYPLLGPNDTAAIVARYPQLPALPAHAAFFPSTSRAYGEATFICPAVNVLDAMGRHWDSARLWYYRYNVYDEDNFAWGMGVLHLFEAAAVFGADNILGAPASYYSYNAPIIPVVMNYWISFVRALDPNTFRYASAPVWGSWGPNGSRMVFETGNLTMEDTPGDQAERCDFWLSLAGVTEQKV